MQEAKASIIAFLEDAIKNAGDKGAGGLHSYMCSYNGFLKRHLLG